MYWSQFSFLEDVILI